MLTKQPGHVLQAMVHLLGLQGVPSADQGFVYTHPESGYIFELRDAAPTSYESSDDEAPGNDAAKEPEELEYRPLQLGTVSQVSNTVMASRSVNSAAQG